MSKPRLKKRIARLRRKIFPVKVKPDPHFQTIESPQINPNLVISDRELADYEFKIISYIISQGELRATESAGAVAASELFDAAYYLDNNCDVLEAGVDPLHHYCVNGWREFRDPSSYFSTSFYRRQIKNKKINPLLHYITEGRELGLSPKEPSDPYLRWIHNNEKSLNREIESAAHIISGWSENEKPHFSIILPVYNTDPQLLDRAIETVIDQAYTNWELCISDDASTEPHIGPLLEKWAQKDDRIKVHYRDKNGHISANSNSALDLAVGDYCVLMDHDDELRPHSLFEVAKVIIEKPETLFIYSDEDKIDYEGNRKDPHFKSSWNPDLFYVQNYLNHLTVLKTSRLREIGGWRIGYEGSQDHDLYLRFLHDVDKDQITHIPKILYHWRAIEGSAAYFNDEKNYTHDAGVKALSDYFHGIDKGVKVSNDKHFYRIHYPIPDTPPLVSLIMPMKDLASITQVCVESILEKTDYPHYEILIVNNNSEEAETFDFLSDVKNKSSRVRVIDYEQPFNFSAINNYAVKHAKGEIIGLINNDMEIINDDWLSEMVSHAVRPEIGCVGAKLYYPDNTIQHAGVILGIGGVAGHSHKYISRGEHGYFSRAQLTQNFSAVTAALLLVEKSIYEKVGGLNEDHLKVAFNDIDFCLKVMNTGLRNLWTPYAEAYHHESKSRGAEDSPEKIKRFHQEMKYMHQNWANAIDHDPYYSPHLSRDIEDFTY